MSGLFKEAPGCKRGIVLEREEVSFAFELQSCQKVNLAVISMETLALESSCSGIFGFATLPPSGRDAYPEREEMFQQQCFPNKGVPL